MADRIVVMRDGVLQQFGTPQQVFNEPANVWIATFVGDPPMNILPGTLQHQDGRLVVRSSEYSIEVPARMKSALEARIPSAADVQLGIRPDALTLSSMAGPEHPISGVVYAVQLLGDVELVDVRVGSSRVLVRAALGTVNSRDINRTVYLGHEPDRLYFFDADSGEAITQA